MAEAGNGVFGGRARSVELLWGRREPPKRGPKPGLSVEVIVRTAIAIADAEGLPAFSMQRVAGEFGFTTMSLYRYVPGKTELIDLMIDTALGPPPDLAEYPDWRAKLEVWAGELHEVYHRHLWVARAVTDDRLMGPNELAWVEAAARALLGTGLTGGETTDAVRVVSSHVRSWAQYSADMAGDAGMTGRQWGAAIAALIEEHSADYPALAEAMRSGAFGPVDGSGPQFGLRCVLDGIGVRIAERRGGSTG